MGLSARCRHPHVLHDGRDVRAQRCKVYVVRRRKCPDYDVHWLDLVEQVHSCDFAQPSLQPIACDGRLTVLGHDNANARERAKGGELS